MLISLPDSDLCGSERQNRHEGDEGDEGEDEDECTHSEGDLQAVVIISAAQVTCLSVSASVRLVRVKG